ncbi:CatA-like O-acetyltransferase [Methanobrevibacter sp.]|uniref:CatA-like O-acetyltransferase n=1 Tax=Methanobrevibacter sp. TaxID=66852 RepID=UPI003863B208
MKEIEFNLDENPFINFQSARYMMSARVDVKKLWNYCKNNDKSFFVLTLGCMINATNSVPKMKYRILDGKVFEFEYLEGVCPIMDEGQDIYKEMRVRIPQEFDNILDWHEYVKKLSEDILKGRKDGFSLEMEKRDFTNIANFSCIPWVDFDAVSSCALRNIQIQPLITWGKVNDDYEMSVSITVSHIFVNGSDLGYFYENLQKELDLFE